MTATYQGIGNIGNGTTSISSHSLPASLANGDLVLLMVVAKPDTATIGTPSGWTSVANVSGGGGTTGDSVGPTRQAWFSRVKDASWSGPPSPVLITGGTSAASVLIRVTGTAPFDITAATGVYGTSGTVTDGASTLGSDPGIASGDLLLCGYSNMDEAPTWSAQGITAPGATIGAATERSEAVETTSGFDIGGMLFTASATAGTSSGAPSTAATLSAAGRGTAVLVRVREAAVVPEVTASLTGSGALSAVIVAVGITAASLTGSGAFTAQSSAVAVVAAPFSGSGEFTALVGNPEVDATLVGSGAFTAQSSAVGVVAAPLTGAGAFTATIAGLVAEVDADLTGSGSFAAEVETFGQVLAKLTGSGEFTADIVSVAITDTTNRVGGRRRGGYAVATWEPPVAAAPAAIVQGHAADFALAFGPVTMNGTQPDYDIDRVEKARLRDRIIVGGVDITYFRDKPTPLPAYQLVSPLLYGPATLRIPQIATPFEEVGTGDHSWCRPEKAVLVQRVDADTGEVMATDYKGVIIAIDTSGRDLTVEIGGEASGRAALMERQIPIFRFTNDLGVYAYRAIRSLGLPFEPYLGPDTGIKMGRFGGTGYLDYISQLCARAWTRAGNQWTIMPVNGVYRMFRKDTATIDATAYLDDAMTVGNLRRDLAEEPNRIYATVITPEGQRVDGAVFPGLQKSHPAPYPFNDNRNFGLGTTNAGTDTGDGISVMIDKLRVQKYMDAPDAPGGYDADAAAGIRQLQDDADLPVTGTMTPATWRALYDLDATGFSLRQSSIEPAAQKGYTKQWIKSGSGAIMRRHVGYDPRRLKRDRNIDLGSGFTIAQRLEFAQAERDVAEDNWVGTITFHTGGLVNGTHAPGDPVTDANVKRARALRPGMNLSLPYSPGGPITVHISAISVAEDGKVTATVDTRARDSMAVWEVLARNRESRANPARQWVQQHRASGTTRDAIDGWYAVGGLLGSKVTVPGHKWEVFEVVAGQEGTVARLLTETNPDAEYVVAVFGRKIPGVRLGRLIGNPLTKRGARKWADEGVRNQLDRSHLMLYVAGDSEQPCGYFPRNKRPETVITDETNPDYDPTADPDHVGTDDEPTIEVETETGSITPLTGKWKDDAGFGYRTFAQPVIYVAVYADRDTSIPAGRIMWPQLEAGA